MPKITIDRVQRIIREEIARLEEGTDHESAAKVMSGASKLLSAIETFKESSSEKANADLGESLSNIEQILNRIISSPMQYVDATKPPQKKVSLKPQGPIT